MKKVYNIPLKIINTNNNNYLNLGRLFSKLSILITTSINIKYKAKIPSYFNKYNNKIIKFKSTKNIKLFPLYSYIIKNNLYINIKYLYSMLSNKNKKYFIKYIII